MRNAVRSLLATLALVGIAATAHAQFVTPTFLLAWGSFGNGPGSLDRPYDVAVSSTGEVFVLDSGNSRVQVFDRQGTYLRGWGGPGSGNGQFTFPSGLALGPNGDVFITDSGNNRIQAFASDGTFLRKWGTFGTGNLQFNYPWGIDVDNDGTVYVMDRGNSRVSVFTSEGGFVRRWPAGTGSCNNLALDHHGHVWITDHFYHRIREYSTTGTTIAVIGDGEGTGNGYFNVPAGIAIDGSGRIFIVDAGNNQVQVLSSTGAFLGQWGNATLFDNLVGVEVDTDGNVFTVEYYRCRVSVYATQSPVPANTATWGSLKARYR